MTGVFLPELYRVVNRGTVAFFEPTAEETHRFVGTWFQDDEIYEFIGSNIAEIPRHSIRFYTTANELKRLNLPWQETLVESWTSEARVPKPKREEMNRDLMVAVQIYCEEQTTADRHRRWHQDTGKGHSTFDGHVKKAKAAGLLAVYQPEFIVGKPGNRERDCPAVDEEEAAEIMAAIKAAVENLQAGTSSKSLVPSR